MRARYERRRLLVGTTTVLLSLLAFLALFGAPWGGADVSNKVTDASLAMLNPGMTEEEVRETLGPPLGQESERLNQTVWKYSRPVKHVRWYPQVSVLFEGSRLVEVLVERRTFWGVDRDLRYWLMPTGERWIARGFSTGTW